MKKNEVIKINKGVIDSNNSIVKKSNTLVAAKCGLNINEQKILYKVISQIRIDDKDFKDYVIKTADLIKFIGTNSQTIYRDLKQYTQNLLKEVLVIEEGDRTIQTNWFSVVEYVSNHTILFSFHPKLKPYLLDLKKSFTRFGIENIKKFKSKYSPKVYEILKQYENIGCRIVTISDIRKMLCLEDVYKNYNDFKKKVLLVAQEEVNACTDLMFDFEEIKEGRKVVEIIFHIKSKKIDITNSIDLPIESCKNKLEKAKVCTDVSNHKVSSLKEKIKEIIKDEVHENKLIEWIELNKERDINFYLNNWSDWDWKTKTTKAGFFIDLVDNNRPIPTGEKGIRASLDKPIQTTNYEQREYNDDYFDGLYANFTEEEIKAMRKK